MEKSIKQDFSIFLARRYAQGFFCLAFLFSVTVLAAEGWEILGDNVKLVFLEGKETSVLLSVAYYPIIGILVIYEILYIVLRIRRQQPSMSFIKSRVRLYFSAYVSCGVFFYMCFIGTEILPSVSMLEKVLGNILIYFLFRRITAVNDRKLKLKIFPESENEEMLEGLSWTLPDGWEKYLILKCGIREKIEKQSYISNGIWLAGIDRVSVKIEYRLRYSPFTFTVENEYLALRRETGRILNTKSE